MLTSIKKLQIASLVSQWLCLYSDQEGVMDDAAYCWSVYHQ